MGVVCRHGLCNKSPSAWMPGSVPKMGSSTGASPSPSLRAGIAALIGLVVGLSGHTAQAQEWDIGSALIVGVGGAYTAAADESGVLWFNPALIALAEERGGFGLSYRRQYDLDELGEADASARYRAMRGLTVAAGFARFGESGLYQETRGIAALAEGLEEKWAFGAGLRYQRVEFGDGDMAFAGVSLDLGVAGRPVKNTTAGVSVRRITLDHLYAKAEQEPGSVVEASVAWSAPPDIVIAGVWSKQSDDDHSLGLGQRLRIASGAEFVSGLRFDPIRYTLGGRLTHRGGTIDYVYQSHPDLGGTHTIGIGWQW